MESSLRTSAVHAARLPDRVLRTAVYQSCSPIMVSSQTGRFANSRCRRKWCAWRQAKGDLLRGFGFILSRGFATTVWHRMERSEDTTDAPVLDAGKHGNFSATHWSIVLAAGANDLTRATAALERLCRTYWYPIYAFIRRRG